jgi:FtsH-binding integral membrane protein
MMSDFDRNIAGRNIAGIGPTMTQAETAIIDAGLRAYMLRVFNYMMIGLAVTGVAAIGIYLLSVTDTVANAAYVIRGRSVIPATAGMVVQSRDVLLTSIGYTVFVSPLKWAIIFAPLAIVFALSFGVERMRPATAQLLFWVYSALVGLSLGSIFLVFTHTSIARVFFITAASFGALALWGYTTKRDLSGLGSFLIMGVVGIIIASLVNIFLASSALQWVVAVVGVLAFAGLTAYDTQRLKSEYLYGAMGDEVLERSAVMGALSLYLDFVNLFTFLLQLVGQRED